MTTMRPDRPAGAAVRHRAKVVAALAIVLSLQLSLELELTRHGSLTQGIGWPHAGLWLYLSTLPTAAVAVWLLSRCRFEPRAALLVLLGASAAFQVAAMTHAPTSSDDDYRYIWDAKVQLAGIDPYRYVPEDPRLFTQRDEFLFPTHGTCPHPIPSGCTAINRPSVHTIYPPVAESAFVAIRIASFGGHGGHLPLQIAAGIGVLLIGWLLARAALARGRPLWTAAIWAWSPLPIVEYANAAHIDWLAILLLVLAFGTAAARRTGLSSALVGAAIATKLYPAVVLPALMRRHPARTLGAALAVVAIAYLPHVMAVGTAVVGYLPGYLHEEQYTSGGRMLLLGAVLPHPVDSIVGIALLAGVAFVVARHRNVDHPERSATVLMGTTLLIATPAYGWYAGALLALTVLSALWEWLPVALVPTIVYLAQLGHPHVVVFERLLYATAALTTLVCYCWRRRVGPTRAVSTTTLARSSAAR